jgi:hypothetical protein
MGAVLSSPLTKDILRPHRGVCKRHTPGQRKGPHLQTDRYRAPPDATPAAEPTPVDEVVVEPFRGSVLVGVVVLVVDADAVALAFFLGLILGIVVVVVVVVAPVVAFSTSCAEASSCSIAAISAWYCDRSCAFSAACALL